MDVTRRSVGIDLGTTYSCAISADDPSREEIILNSLDEALTPSVVHITDEGSFTVGREAKDRLVDDPDRVVVGIKRRMGTDFPLEFAGHELTPEGLSALILRSLADDSSRQMGVPVADLRAVVTVPAYFGVAEKEATFAAARIAGLRCDQLLPEPVAAVYGYDVPEDPAVSSLVYDLGGGTFDVAVVQVDGGDNRVWAVDGESRLGGLDWDSRLVDAFWEQLNGLDGLDDLRYDEEFVAAVEQAAETVKRRLTGAAAAKERLRFRGRFFTLEMIREEFEERTADLMSRTMDAVDRVLEAATRLGAPPVCRIILVGGSTRMPMVTQRLEEHLGLPVLLADPDRAVARGAARWAARLLAEETAPSSSASGIARARSASLVPVLPKALGIKLHSSGSPWRDTPYVAHFLMPNTTLPVVDRRIHVGTIVDDQDRAKIEIYEQSGVQLSPELEANDLLVEGEIVLAPGLPAGSAVALDVSVDMDGLIRISAADSRTGRGLEIEAFMHGVLDDEQLAQQTSTVSAMRLVR